MTATKKIIITVAGFILWGLGLMAQPAHLLDSAAQYYTNNKFEQAIISYRNILEQGYESAELYYNLGNAYYKSNKIPYAIVNYERAKKLSANDPDIEFNLHLANTHVVDKIDVLPEFFLSSWWNKLIITFSSNQWAIASMCSFLIALLGFLIFFLSTSRIIRQIGFWLGGILLITAIFTFNFSRKQYWVAQNEPDAIILTPSIVVKSSPSEGGTELFLIHEGLKVKITDKLGEWREIKLTNGNEGWIKETDLIII